MASVRKHDRLEFQCDPFVQEWIATVNPNTAQTYVLSLLYYCTFLEKTPKKLLVEEAAAQDRLRRAPQALGQTDSARYRLQGFAKWLQEDHADHILITRVGAGRQHGTHRIERPFQKQTRRTIFKIVGAVRSFYAFKNLTLPRLRLFRRIGKPFVGATTAADIAKALHHADLRTKALIFVAATTGRSPGDLLKLRVGDIDRTRFPGWGFVYNPEQTRQKTGVEQISWVTPEALEHVDRYLSTRAQVTPSGYLFTESQNDREQLLNPDSARRSLQRLAQSVFKGQRENPISFRNLRAWFGTQLDRNPGGYPHKQILLSHVAPYGGAYSRPTIDELFHDVKALYDQGFTRILATPEEHQWKTMEQQLREETDKRLAEQQEQLRQEFRENIRELNKFHTATQQELKETFREIDERVNLFQQALEHQRYWAQEKHLPELAEGYDLWIRQLGGDIQLLRDAFKDKSPEESWQRIQATLPVLKERVAENEALRKVLQEPDVHQQLLRAKKQALEELNRTLDKSKSRVGPGGGSVDQQQQQTEKETKKSGKPT